MKIRKEDFEYFKFLGDDDKKIIKGLLEESPDDDKINIIPASDIKEEAWEIAMDPFKVRGIATGYKKLDSYLCGLDKGELIIVAGETSVGKSLFAVNLALKSLLTNENKEKVSILFFSLEMPVKGILARFMMINPDVVYGNLYFYDNKKGADIPKVRQAIDVAIKKHNINYVVIDHLHYFPMAKDNQAAEVGRITREIKGLAMEFDIPIVLLSHLRRKPAGSADKEPHIDDLKDSSSIGQDADIIIMLKRDDMDEETRNIMSVFVRKNRNKGRTGNLNMFINFKNLQITEGKDFVDEANELFS